MSKQIALRTDELTLAKCAADCLADTDSSWKFSFVSELVGERSRHMFYCTSMP